MSNKIKYEGSCHCGNVKFEVLAPPVLQVTQCNCSMCTKKQNNHVIVPGSDFKLISGEGSLRTYTFNTGAAQHMFCTKCGVQSFYRPRSNPNDVGIMPHCLDSPQPIKVVLKQFDGQNWEKAEAQDLAQVQAESVN